MNENLHRTFLLTSLAPLQKAFENILRNALQHTVDNTTVDVTLSNTEGYRVTVEDHGAGVPDDE